MESPIRKSDVDILVIMETDSPRHKRPVGINRALLGAGDPKRYPCLHAAEIDDWKDVPEAFVTQVIKKGVVVYDKDSEAI